MDTPDIEVNKAEVFEAGATESFEAKSETFIPNDLTELVRRLQLAAENVASATEFALPGDRALLVGLAVQIDSIARLFVNSAEAAAAAAEEAEEAYGVEDDDDADS